MANTKISALTAGAPAVATDLIPIDRAGVNYSLQVADMQKTLNGAAIPASKTVVGTNGSSQIIDASSATLSNNTSGTAANLSGTPALPNGVTATTQTAHDASSKLATTNYADELSPNLTGAFLPPWPPGNAAVASAQGANNNVSVVRFSTLTRILITHIWVNITTGGTGGNPLFDVGLYDSTGTSLLVHLGATAGTIGAKQAAISGGGSYQLEPGTYYFAYTSNDDTIVMDGVNIGRTANVLNAGSTKFCGTATASTGGALNSSIGTVSASQLSLPLAFFSAA